MEKATAVLVRAPCKPARAVVDTTDADAVVPRAPQTAVDNVVCRVDREVCMVPVDVSVQTQWEVMGGKGGRGGEGREGREVCGQ